MINKINNMNIADGSGIHTPSCKALLESRMGQSLARYPMVDMVSIDTAIYTAIEDGMNEYTPTFEDITE